MDFLSWRSGSGGLLTTLAYLECFGGLRNLPEPLELCIECLNTTKNFLWFPLLHSLVIPKKTVISICSCPPSYTLNFLFCTGVSPVSKVVMVLGEQWRDSVIHIHGSILLSTPLPSRLPHHSRQSSMCDTVGPWWLSILKKVHCQSRYWSVFKTIPKVRCV